VITVSDVDRLVVKDDAAAARLWPRLGPRVRKTYLQDRDRWIALRRQVEAGQTLPASTLAAERKVFSGWARAFDVAGRPGPRRRPAPAAPTAKSAPVAADVAPAPALAASAPAPAAPALSAAVVKKGGAGTAVAGGLVLAGLIAVAARRKRA